MITFLRKKRVQIVQTLIVSCPRCSKFVCLKRIINKRKNHGSSESIFLKHRTSICNNQKVEWYIFNSPCYLRPIFMFYTVFLQPYLINSIFVTFYVSTLVTCPIWKVNILGQIQYNNNNFFILKFKTITPDS